jgi:heavy metal translocating P-type ATPase
MSLRRYPLVIAGVVVGVLGLVLLLTPAAWLVGWIISIFALLVAAREAVTMVRKLLKGQVGLDVLAVTAIVATVVVGEYWASLIIVLMLAGGEALEDYAAGRAERDLRALLDRVPQRAHRYGPNDELVDIPVESVAVGDRLLVRPSEIVPVDCELVSDATSLDESSLTGESMPVDKVRGDGLLSGSVNGPAAVDVVVTALAADSQYQRIIELVREASASKSPMVRLADRYALPFTAVAFVIAGIAWAVSGDPLRFAEVLVVATPCPLLLAAPVAFMAGMSRAAKTGIVMKGSKSLEILARARTVAFDKTGTLTRGMPEVVAVLPVSPMSEATLLGYVASTERYSSHVLAQSLQDAALQRDIPLKEAVDAHEVATHGIEARIDGLQVIVGKPSFVGQRVTGLTRHEGASGEAPVYVGIDGRYAGVVVLRDEVRPESAATLAALKRLGVTTTMLITGDVEQTARPIAASLGISVVHAECLPADKVEFIRAATPRPVIMVGDGVNDAPVLAAADVGIALGARGSTAASESADVVILVDDLTRVSDAVEIGHRTVSIALQSIWLGIGASVVLMVVASFGLIPAVLGAALQEVVDLLTILGALRALSAGRAARATRPARSVPAEVVGVNSGGALRP